MSGVTLSLTDQPAAEDLATIGDSLAAFNADDVGPSGRTLLAVLVRDAGGKLVGGISGYTAWGWLYVQWLWMDKSLRGQGWASRMLAAAEAEATARGCRAAWIDTFNPVALKVYQRAGYVPFGALEGFPEGRTRTFLQKRW